MKKSYNIEYIDKGATIEGAHRFSLHRTWDESKPKCLWIMLNPSWADDREDDNTIKRVVSFSFQNGYGGFMVGNLSSYITPYPDTLYDWLQFTENTAYWRDKNLKTIYQMGDKVGPKNIIFAWGSKGDNIFLLHTVSRVIHEYGKNARIFGITKANHPKHPLYLPKYSQLIPYPHNNKIE